MENITEEKKQKQVRYSEKLENDYKRAFEVLEKNGYVFEKSLNFQISNLEADLPIIGKLIGLEIKKTNLIEQVINYLENTNGKHLCLLGSCGTGKTLLATKIIPLLFSANFQKIFKVIKACDLSERLQEAKSYPFVVIDDFGTESTAVNFGNKVEAFNEVIDSVEGRKCFVVVTSNLDANQIKQKYGVRTYDRLRGLFKVIQVNEKSMRN
jgi:DNA replication protein DnaC